MMFTIVERKIKIEDELRQYALRKVEKLDRYFQQDSDTTLTFSELRGKQTVDHGASGWSGCPRRGNDD